MKDKKELEFLKSIENLDVINVYYKIKQRIKELENKKNKKDER